MSDCHLKRTLDRAPNNNCEAFPVWNSATVTDIMTCENSYSDRNGVKKRCKYDPYHPYRCMDGETIDTPDNQCDYSIENNAYYCENKNLHFTNLTDNCNSISDKTICNMSYQWTPLNEEKTMNTYGAGDQKEYSQDWNSGRCFFYEDENKCRRAVDSMISYTDGDTFCYNNIYGTNNDPCDEEGAIPLAIDKKCSDITIENECYNSAQEMNDRVYRCKFNNNICSIDQNNSIQKKNEQWGNPYCAKTCYSGKSTDAFSLPACSPQQQPDGKIICANWNNTGETRTIWNDNTFKDLTGDARANVIKKGLGISAYECTNSDGNINCQYDNNGNIINACNGKLVDDGVCYSGKRGIYYDNNSGRGQRIRNICTPKQQSDGSITCANWNNTGETRIIWKDNTFKDLTGDARANVIKKGLGTSANECGNADGNINCQYTSLSTTINDGTNCDADRNACYSGTIQSYTDTNGNPLTTICTPQQQPDGAITCKNWNNTGETRTIWNDNTFKDLTGEARANVIRKGLGISARECGNADGNINCQISPITGKIINDCKSNFTNVQPHNSDSISHFANTNDFFNSEKVGLLKPESSSNNSTKTESITDSNL